MSTYGTGLYGSGTYGDPGAGGGRAVMALSKRTIRHDVADILGDLLLLSTSGAGAGGGTTAVFSSLAGVPIASVQNKYLLLESGTYEGEYRVCSAFTPSSGTATVRRAYTGQVASGVTAYLHEYSPELYTRAINDASRAVYRSVRRPILHHAFVRSAGQQTLAMPRGMERVMRVMEDRTNSQLLRDFFDRSNSTTAPGSNWTASTGTFGITSESLYCVSDTDADLLLAATNPQVKNGILEAVVRGDTTSGASRVLALVFRYEDTSNYLYVYLENNTVYLNKRDGGSNSNLTSTSVTTTENVDYQVRVLFDGSWVRVWVDDYEYITYELQGSNLKYLGFDESGTGTYGNVGFRLDKTGSPSLAATATRVAHYFLHEVVGTEQRGDWEEDYSGHHLQFNTRNRGTALTEGRVIHIEGMAELTALAADTTFEALTSDTTATAEIERTDPAYEAFINRAAYEVLRRAAQPAHTGDAGKRQEYAARAAEQLALAERLRATRPQRYKPRTWG